MFFRQFLKRHIYNLKERFWKRIIACDLKTATFFGQIAATEPQVGLFVTGIWGHDPNSKRKRRIDRNLGTRSQFKKKKTNWVMSPDSYQLSVSGNKVIKYE